MAITPTETTQQLAQRLQRLPQELYDKVYDFTFTPVDTTQIRINRGYAPPSTLQVDRKSREEFAKTYYSTASFHGRDLFLINGWVHSLSEEHQDLLRSITYEEEVKRTNTSIGGSTGHVVLVNNVLRRASSQPPARLQLVGMGMPQEVAMVVKHTYVPAVECGDSWA